MARVLFLTSRLPFPPVGGDRLRTFNFIKYLNKRHDLTLVTFIESDRDRYFIKQYQSYFNKIIIIKLPKWRSYLNCVRGLIDNRPLQIHYYYSKQMEKKISVELKNDYDVIFCHLIRMAQYLPPKNNIKKIVDFTDAISLNYLRSKNYRSGLFSLLIKLEYKRVRMYELNRIDNSDYAVFISKIDANFLKTNKNQNKIKIIGNGVDLDNLFYYNGNYDNNLITFLGNMRTFPNTDAVLYFVKDVMPKLLKIKKNIQFYIVGSEPNRAVRKLHNGKNIFVTGYVESVLPFLQKSLALVAPMRAGAGIQNKILEALAVGTPVITTPIGAEGLDEEKLLIANSPDEFCKHIINLSKNQELRKTISQKGRDYVERNFKWEKVLENLEMILEK